MYGFSAGAQALWTFLQFGSAEDLSFVNVVLKNLKLFQMKI